MNKKLTIIVIFFLSYFLAFPNRIIAQTSSDKAENKIDSNQMMEEEDDDSDSQDSESEKMEKISDDEDDDGIAEEMDEEEEIEMEDDESFENATKSAGIQNRFENAIRKSQRLMEQIENPEVGNQIQNTIQVQNEIRSQVEEGLNNLEKRRSVIKFLIGPDYKNAGEVRSQLVRLENQIREMEKIRTQLSDPNQQSILDEVISELKQEQTALQTTLEQKLEGFSLFGWLARLISGY